jgi:hypothetical protein
VSRADPKHGRWILPLVIAGLIGFTYLFVNALPPAPESTTDTTSPGAVSGTTQPGDGNEGTATTTGPVDEAFLTAVDDLATRTAAMATEAQEINTAWDEGTATSEETSTAFTELSTDADALSTEISSLEVPAAAADAWTGVIQSSIEFADAAAAMLDGFANQPGSEGRLAALDQFTTAAADMATGFEEARTAVGG